MKRILFFLLIIGLVLWTGGYLFYRLYLPDLVANAMISDEKPPYIPKRIMNRIDELKAPVNKGVDEMVAEMKRNDVPVEKVLDLVDKADEDTALALLDDLKQQKPKTPDQVFDIAKNHLKADFDVEIFREAFVKNVSMKSIRKAISYASTNQRTKDLDLETGRAIARQIIIQKYKEVDINKKSN